MPDLPAPLTPPDCDLHGLEWMPFYGNRLFSSETWLISSATARCASLALWWSAFKERPAGSLPDDDRALAHLAGLGGSVRAWHKVKDEALRGFIRCSDGRIYHPVVCELALVAWEKRLAERTRKEAWRRGQNADKTRTERGTDAVVPDDRTGQDISKLTPLPPKPNGANGHGPNRWGDAAIQPAGPRDSRPDAPCVNGFYLEDTFDGCLEVARINPAGFRGDWKPVVAWLKAGIEPATIKAAIARCAEWENYHPPRSLAYFDKPVREYRGLS